MRGLTNQNTIDINIMSYFFTSESVSEGHPDKVSDQISDAIIDAYLALDPSSKVACETLVTTNQIVLAGEVKSSAKIDAEFIARQVVRDIGYNKPEYLFHYKTCKVLNLIHEQSSDINQGVERENIEDQGAGDQGMMFGYATNETDNYMPLALDLSHKILIELAKLRRENNEIKYLRPDSKAQVTLQYNDLNIPKKIEAIVISTQHDDFDDDLKMLKKIKNDLINILIPRVREKYLKYDSLFNKEIKYHINPTGKFVIGGPHGDTGLTGRKIIVDTYGGKGAHGGGAFSGKDPSKVDRSAAYATRHIAKNLVASGLCNECLVQVSYAIGVAEPTSLNINTFNTANIKISDEEISSKILQIFNLKPYFIEQSLNLRSPIYLETSKYGHMGRVNIKKKKQVNINFENSIEVDVDLFPWEKLDYIEKIKESFGL